MLILCVLLMCADCSLNTSLVFWHNQMLQALTPTLLCPIQWLLEPIVQDMKRRGKRRDNEGLSSNKIISVPLPPYPMCGT